MTLTRVEIPLRAADGAAAELIIVQPAAAHCGLLWIPALGVTARNYLAYAETLAQRGVAVALHEWRGAGSSSLRAARSLNWGYRELLDLDMPASLAAARAAQPNLPWMIGGHSLGAQLAALFAARHAAELAGLVIVAGGSPYWRSFPMWKRPLVRLIFAYFGALARLVGYFPGRRVGFGGNEARGVIADWRRSGISGVYRPTGIGDDLEAAMATMALPMFVAHMQHDEFIPRGCLDFWLGKMPRAAQHVEFMAPGDFVAGKASHFSWLKESQPVVERIATWLPGALAKAAATRRS